MSETNIKLIVRDRYALAALRAGRFICPRMPSMCVASGRSAGEAVEV